MEKGIEDKYSSLKEYQSNNANICLDLKNIFNDLKIDKIATKRYIVYFDKGNMLRRKLKVVRPIQLQLRNLVILGRDN